MKNLFGIVALSAAAGLAAADVRIIHASPDTGAVDLYVNEAPDGSPFLSGLTFPNDTGYVDLATGTYDFFVTPAGQTAPIAIDLSGTAIDENVDISVFAIDFFANIRAGVYVDDRVSVADKSKVRFIHLSPDAGTVDVQFDNAGGVVFDDYVFEQASGYLELDPGTLDLEAVALDLGGAVIDLDPINLQAGFNYTVAALGSVNQGNFQVKVLVDATPAPGSLGLLALGGLAATRRRR
ncbi:MAG: DUF4397 domain-containing protein [Phycisphaerales bacterium JB037]